MSPGLMSSSCVLGMKGCESHTAGITNLASVVDRTRSAGQEIEMLVHGVCFLPKHAV